MLMILFNTWFLFKLYSKSGYRHWPPNPCNVAGCETPLFDLLEIIGENGRKTAIAIYG
jgi:hypothetical protein